MDIRAAPGTLSSGGQKGLPGRAYFLRNTLGSSTHRLNRAVKTAPAAMISIVPFAPQGDVAKQYGGQVLPTICQVVNSL